MTRREFLGDSALLAAAQVRMPAQTAAKGSLLSSLWNSDKLATAARGAFHPFPSAGERAGWEGLPADARSTLIAAGERQLETPWEVLPATVALQFARNGNRSHYEALSFGRRGKLGALTLAECAEGKGRFLDEIVNGIWLISEETFWGVPAHLGAQKARVGLPDVTEPIVDLFAAETAAQLSWTLYLLESQLRQVSPLVPDRIRVETSRRLLAPCLERNFNWMGFNTPPPNNWDPWICSNWLTSVLLVESDEKRRVAALQKIAQCLDHFLSGYADDGGCDEGPSYWGRAGASLFDCLELLYQASNGALNAYNQPLIHQIGLYICRSHIAGDWYTNFSDAPARVHTDGDLVYRFGRRLGDDTMARHGAYATFAGREDAIPSGSSLGRALPALFNLAEFRKAPRAEALLRDSWMPGIGVMTARVKEGSSQGLYVGAQAGHNGKSHNHNDVGNFVVYADGAPVIIDVGVETYTAKTFSSKRYEIWTMQSAFHNCPTIDGVLQSPGRQFAASSVACHQDDHTAELRMDIAQAYPKNTNLESWKRSIRLDRARNQVEVADEYSLNLAAKEITLTLMTPCRVDQQPGTLRLEDRARIAYDPALSASVEEIKVEDGRLRAVWGERLYRILLRAANPPRQGRWAVRISQA
jgi:hypothetical protein